MHPRSPRLARLRFPGLAAAVLLAVGFTSGCNSTPLRPADFSGHTPVVRVLLLSDRPAVTLTAEVPPTARLLGNPDARHVDLAPATPASLTLTAAGWRLGSATIASHAELTIIPAAEGTVRVDGRAYRGRLRFVPRTSPTTGGPTFDVVNDVDVENYLRGVIAREMLPEFAPAALAAQAVAARTYTLYTVRAAGPASRYDLFADERSQVYGGLASETPKARAAVEQTAGEVVAYGPPDHERIFKAYFSSCCGGRGQSAADAFGDAPIPPLAAQGCGTECALSTSYTWPPIVVTKADLTRRFRHWGQAHNRPERDMAAVQRIDVAGVNALGRPVHFDVFDARGKRYALTGEEVRTAVNIDAPAKLRLPSSLFQLDVRRDTVGFVNGHGRGHGVGMCQWCAQARALHGLDYRQIVLTAYPSAVILRAY